MPVTWRRRIKESYRAVVSGTGRILPPGRARNGGWHLAPIRDSTWTLRRILAAKDRGASTEPPLAPVLTPDVVTFRPGDTVLAAEPFLDRAHLRPLLALRGKGVRLACIAYDLIPDPSSRIRV